MKALATRHRSLPARPRAIALSIHLMLAGAAGVALLQPVVAQAAEPAKSYAIPAGPLGDVLAQFAAQAGVKLSFDPALLAGQRSAGLQGSYSVNDGFARILSGSGYELAAMGNGAYTLRKAPQGSSTTLPAVTVTAQADNGLPGAYAGGQVAKGGRLGLLGSTNFMDTPFNQTSYTAEVIEDQQARSLSDLLINDPSVRLSSARTNINEDFSIRGFTVASQDVAFNGMYGLMPFFRVPIEMAERVEVLKGPSSLLNGMPPSGNVGGAINITPKRAGNDPLNRITASYLSESIFGMHADIGRRFGTNKEFGVRFNAAYRDGDTTLDKQQQTDQVYSLGLDYQGERLRASLDVIYQDQNINRVVRQFMAGPALTAMPKAPDSSLNYPGYGRSRTDDKTVVARAEYDVNDSVTVYGGVGKRDHNMDAIAGNPTLLNTAGDFTDEQRPSAPTGLGAAWQLYKVNNRSYEAGADVRFTTGSVKHKLALNYSKVETKTDIDFDTAWPVRPSNIYHPIYTPTPSLGNAVGDTSINYRNYSDNTLTSYAIADTLAFHDDKIKLTVGARHQNVKSQAYNFMTGAPLPGGDYDESKITPVVGIVYQPQSNLSLYANYIEGLSPGSKAPLPMTTVIPPIKTKQYEVGTKVDWGKFATTFSLFQIERPSAGLNAASTSYGLNGEQRNRGAEFNIFGEVARNVRMLGGLTLMDSTLTKTTIEANEGNDAVAVPRMQANLGVDWDNSLAPGVGLNARVVYTGKQYADPANNLKMPSWTRFDIGARYKTKFGEKPVILRANIENVFDKNYWAASNEGYIYIGMPRTLLLSATMDF
jgi:iron complex outermembrane recepter protein